MFRLQMVYKIIHSIVDLSLPDYIEFNRGITRGHDNKLVVPTTRIDSYRYSFYPFTIKLWNNLHPSTVHSISVTVFNNLLVNKLQMFNYD